MAAVNPGTAPGSSECISDNEGQVRLGTWNLSRWHSMRLAPIEATGVELMALQETKLSLLPLEAAKALASTKGYTLHHGHPVPARTSGGHGDSCGVGVLAFPGVAVVVLLPQGAAWRMLHSMSRVHAVQVPPRPGLPLGLRVFSVYAPLRENPARDAFDTAFGEMVAGLDLQAPTLLLGDFNGSVSPQRDYASGAGDVCPLLTRLVGPAGPFLDLQLVVSPEEYAYTFRHSRGDEVRQSRCDLVLGSRSVLPLVKKVFVESGVFDGDGHFPIVVELSLKPHLGIPWYRPSPRLPQLLLLPSASLRDSEQWWKLIDTWMTRDSSSVGHLLSATSSTTASQLSSLLRSSPLCCMPVFRRW